jgi:UDP-glucose 4-epimerase/UDP-arabinose 4-epimerase
MSILVTGGAGYIGSFTVRCLLDGGADVVVLDTMEYGYPQSIPGAPLVTAAITDRDAVLSACAENGVTQVVHFAAYKSVGESMEQPTRYWTNNVAGSVQLVDTLLEAGVDQIVFSSSCSVNGTPDTVPVTEDMPLRPESVYAATKVMVEQILEWYGVTKGLRAVSLRYFNAAGAAADGTFGEVWDRSINLIPMTMKATLGHGPALRVYGKDYPTPDGTCIRDYIHVDDLADAHIRALDYLANGGETTSLNVGTGVGTSVLEIIKATERISGHRVPHEIVDRRPGDPVATYADPSRIGATLGWRATRSLDDIISSAWAWHSSHPRGYEA